MKLFRGKSAIAGIATAILIASGVFANVALADHSSHRHKHQHQQRYLHHGQSHRHNGNRSGWRLSWQHGNGRHYGHGPKWRSNHHHRYNSRHARRHDPRHGSRQHRHFKHHGKHHGRHHGRYNQPRRYVYQGNNDLVGALVGGAIIYHLGRELIRH